jgi:two-component system sensor histidine kinase KdpD
MDEIYEVLAQQIGKLLDRAVILYPVSDRQLEAPRLLEQQGNEERQGALLTSEEERQVARWVCRRGRNAGRGTSVFPEANAYYLAVQGRQEVFAVIGVEQRADDVIPPL